MKICAVYKITNTVTGDFYIGSSKDIKHRWASHKCKSTWKQCPNNQMYQDMQKFGVDKFVFEIIAEVEEGKLKEMEQHFIEELQPTYNNFRAKGHDTERYKKTQKEYNKEYEKTDKRKEYKKEYRKTDKCKKYQKKYQKTDKCKKYKKQYNNQLCLYNGQTLTLCALATRFRKQGIDHPTIEAKKYLIS